MFSLLRRRLSIYGAIMALIPKQFMQYSAWFWAEMIGQVLAMVIVGSFWRAVYASSTTVGGLTADSTIRYILLAQLVAPLVRWGMILEMGGLVSQGGVAIELTRPIDMQARMFAQGLAASLTNLIFKSGPLALFGWLFLGLTFPTDPLTWGAFLISWLLGFAALFCFDWIIACVVFYTTEAWGLHILREGVAAFLSGALIPLAMMPSLLQKVAAVVPFGQALYVPVGLLSGLIPLSGAPKAWLIQIAWIVVLLPLSRFVFSRAVRAVTVQGG
ncbi:MAG TPA: ABC-2 family transporter protein [Symbiobacteriaceae bacterium]|nr:ABC-2 family transporter protein [Symbiobacteriaceae bacterium]